MWYIPVDLSKIAWVLSAVIAAAAAGPAGYSSVTGSHSSGTVGTAPDTKVLPEVLDCMTGKLAKAKILKPPKHRVYLSWNPSATPGARYNVYRWRESGKPAGPPPEPPTRINSVQIAGTSCVDNSVVPGQVYIYRVSAVNLSGESDLSNQTQATIPSH